MWLAFQLTLWLMWRGRWVVCPQIESLVVEQCLTLPASASWWVSVSTWHHIIVMLTLLENMETQVVLYSNIYILYNHFNVFITMNQVGRGCPWDSDRLVFWQIGFLESSSEILIRPHNPHENTFTDSLQGYVIVFAVLSSKKSSAFP